MTFELGVYSFGNTPRRADGSRGPTAQVIRDALDAVELAEAVGLDFDGVPPARGAVEDLARHGG